MFQQYDKLWIHVCRYRGGHILTEPIQTDHLDRFGSVSLVKTLVSVYWIANRHHSVWILVWKDSKWIQTDPIQNLKSFKIYDVSI